jgi:hypothetical protein
VNHLYGTTFEEASEFSRAKKGSLSLVEFAEKTFGAADGKTNMLKEAAPSVEELISMRNAVEHPDGTAESLSSRISRSALTEKSTSRHGIARRMVRPLASPVHSRRHGNLHSQSTHAR